jgi:type III restriction enzyme
MAYLYDTLIEEFGKRAITKVEIPNYITDNLKPGYGEREYQKEAFQRFILFYNEDFEGKPRRPFHLMYNMATGSGKTLIMAGLMLYLYEKGYRNFLFFVHSNTILDKTRENFLNSKASKYLFNSSIDVNGQKVYVKEVRNFDEADDKNINIHFTSIQKLHSDLVQSEKENALSIEDFKNRKIVLLGDEAHHYNANTQSQTQLFQSWERLIAAIHQADLNNILLEFTATLDYESKEIVKKYEDKVVFKYDLKQFRLDKFSKEINLIRSNYEEKERVIQAIILNQYRQELATKQNINLKPVILFKAKQTIKESEQNKLNFHQLIDNLDGATIENIRNTSTVAIVQKAFSFFDSIHLSDNELARRLKANFRPENCLSANDDKEAEANQIKLNTLEDANNPIRAIFAVQKLNEGWDVLNLFDIVRLYEGQNSGGSTKTFGKTTVAEAQLIGRGARYFPFVLDLDQDKFRRKYDDDIENDFKVLEELYYHTKDESKYISELKRALEHFGSTEKEEDIIQLSLELKEDFKATEFYKTGTVHFNKRKEKSYAKVKSFADLGVVKKNYEYVLSSGSGKMSGIFAPDYEITVENVIAKDIKLSTILDQHIIRYALAQNPFFHFDSLSKYFPNVPSTSFFIQNENYLGGVEIAFIGTKNRLNTISNKDYLLAIQGLLSAIETEIKANLTQYEGSDYIQKKVHEVFKDKPLRINKYDERADGQESFVVNEPWYVYNANYGTSEEKDFVKMFAKRFESLNKKFYNIFLIRNEREVKIIDKLGRAFEPDFILFCKQKDGEELTFQVFIEPKGGHLLSHDKWKEDFLKEIKAEKKTIKISTDNYLITGVPFYNNKIENEFRSSLEDVLGI